MRRELYGMMQAHELKEWLGKNCFDIFGITATFNIDLQQLNSTLHLLQKKFHPDNWINHDLSAMALCASAYINSCYDKLKSPLSRSCVLLELKGYPLDLAKDTGLPKEFLMEQMEIHENIDEAGNDIVKLEQMEQIIMAKEQSLIRDLEAKFEQQQFANALELTKQLRFYHRLLNTIADKITLTY